MGDVGAGARLRGAGVPAADDGAQRAGERAGADAVIHCMIETG